MLLGLEGGGKKVMVREFNTNQETNTESSTLNKCFLNISIKLQMSQIRIYNCVYVT